MHGGPQGYPMPLPQTTRSPTPWLTRMARWAPFYNNAAGYGQVQPNGVYAQQAGYSYGPQPGYGYEPQAGYGYGPSPYNGNGYTVSM